MPGHLTVESSYIFHKKNQPDIFFSPQAVLILLHDVGSKDNLPSTDATEVNYMYFMRTDGKNKDFIENCRLLDMDLDRRVGKKIKRDKYKPYNQLDEIGEAIVVYEDNKAIGGGAIRRYDEENIELKRVFVHAEYQGQGVGSELVSRLIEWAAELGYHRMILETGELLAESCAVYKKLGFQVIPNYPPYTDMPESLCMAKDLTGS